MLDKEPAWASIYFSCIFQDCLALCEPSGLGYLAQGNLGSTTRTPCCQNGNRTPPFQTELSPSVCVCVCVYFCKNTHIWTNSKVYFTLFKQKQSHFIRLKVSLCFCGDKNVIAEKLHNKWDRIYAWQHQKEAEPCFWGWRELKWFSLPCFHQFLDWACYQGRWRPCVTAICSSDGPRETAEWGLPLSLNWMELMWFH